MPNGIPSKISAAVEKRGALLAREGDTCFRLFNSTGDGMEGLTVDLYGEYLLIQVFDESLFGLGEPVADAMVKDLAEMGREVRGVLLKNRVKAEEDRLPELRKSGLLSGDLPPGDFTVLHNGLRLGCDLLDYQNTGVFMDMRDVRDAMAPFYEGKGSMLNLFSHTGAFSVHAQAHGVSACVNVDLSRSIHRRAKVNYGLNGLSVDDRDFIAGDVQEWLGIFIKKKRTFPLIVYDPPTFSRNKRRTYRVKIDFSKHIGMLSEISAGGFVLTSINTFSISREEYLSFHPAGWEMVFLKHEAPDFSLGGEPYLKAGLWKTGP
jgi:23S rRNA (cytosine1962-C5)-methyltransferase